MTRAELEHAIRTACSLLGTKEVFIVGSQSILGSYPNISGPMVKSKEVDVLPILEGGHQVAANLINGNAGEGTQFVETHGFEIEGVVEGDLVLPPNWRERTIAICNENTNGCTGHCLEPYDMAVAKLAAGRAKDKIAIINLVKQGIIKTPVLTERVKTLEGKTPEMLTADDLVARLNRWCGKKRGSNENHEIT